MDSISTISQSEIADYLGDSEANDEHDLSSIATCVRIIGRYEVSSPERDADLIAQAMESILTFAADYGVTVDRTFAGENLIDVG